MNEPIPIDIQRAHENLLRAQAEFEIDFFLHGLGLVTHARASIFRAYKWKVDLKILDKLLPSKANVYELKHRRLKDSDEHYSTVLRALRRLERKRFVKLVSSEKEGRRNKTYACTLLGELVIVVARKGMEAASQIIAESSQSFRECLEIRPSHWEQLTMETIRGVFNSKGEDAVTHSDLDLYVRNAEFNWARNNIIKNLNDLSSRPDIRGYLRALPNIKWLGKWLAPTLEKHVEKEGAWLQTLRDCAHLFSANRQKRTHRIIK